MPAVAQRGRIYTEASQFAAELEARNAAAADAMLLAWSDTYWNVRRELDTLLAKIAAAQAAGEDLSPAWAYQQQRLKALLDTTKAQVNKYAADAAAETRAAQDAAVRAASKAASKLASTAVEESLGITASMVDINPELVRQFVGFTGDGSVLVTHLRKTLTDDTVGSIRETIIKGLALGKGQDWYTRQVTRGLALAHSRAVTIMRTETLRVYRETSRQTYAANDALLEGWTWHANLDARTCVACALMDGTLHSNDETLDGHPRCRCAMVPRTKSWEDLGVHGLEDTRPPVRSGKEWLQAQPPRVQEAMMGKAKFRAWKGGQITLDDMVARHQSDDWGTMRAERSLKAILEGRDPNFGSGVPVPDVAPAPIPEPPPAPVLPPEPVAPPPTVKDPTVPFRTTPVDPVEIPSKRYDLDARKIARSRAAITTDDDLVARLAEHAPGGVLEDPAIEAILREEQAYRVWLKTAPADELRAYLATLDPAADPLNFSIGMRVDAIERELKVRFFDPPWTKLPGGAEPPEVAIKNVDPTWAIRQDGNCSNCTSAWELRRRGFSVNAQVRKYGGRNLDEIDRLWGVSAVERFDSSGTALQFKRAVEKLGEGARGSITCSWSGGGAHIFNWEVIDGKMTLWDAQPGRRVEFDTWRNRIKGRVFWARLDDKPLTEDLNVFLRDYGVDDSTP